MDNQPNHNDQPVRTIKTEETGTAPIFNLFHAIHSLPKEKEPPENELGYLSLLSVITDIVKTEGLEDANKLAGIKLLLQQHNVFK
jgi:hypothetical protein